MFDNLGQMMSLMKKAGEIKENLGKMKEELAGKTYETSSGGDLVQVTISGAMEIKSIRISPKALEDRELLEDLVQSAVNNALIMAKSAAQESLKEATGGISLPGLF